MHPRLLRQHTSLFPKERCVSEPIHGFLLLHTQTGHFVLQVKLQVCDACVSKGWNKVANHFMNPSSLLHPKDTCFSLFWVELFLPTDCSFCWSTTGLFSDCSWIFGLRYQGLLCDLFIFHLDFLVFLWLLPMPLPCLSLSHRFAGPWAMCALWIHFSSLTIISPCLW